MVDLEPSLDHLAHQNETGIGQQGCAGIGDQRDLGALLERVHQFRQPLALVVLVEGHQWPFEAEVAEQASGASSVLTGDEIGVDERLAGSIAAAVLAAERGADIVRVHDVAATVDALKVLEGVTA